MRYYLACSFWRLFSWIWVWAARARRNWRRANAKMERSSSRRTFDCTPTRARVCSSPSSRPSPKWLIGLRFFFVNEFVSMLFDFHTFFLNCICDYLLFWSSIRINYLQSDDILLWEVFGKFNLNNVSPHNIRKILEQNCHCRTIVILHF